MLIDCSPVWFLCATPPNPQRPPLSRSRIKICEVRMTSFSARFGKVFDPFWVLGIRIYCTWYNSPCYLYTNLLPHRRGSLLSTPYGSRRDPTSTLISSLKVQEAMRITVYSMKHSANSISHRTFLNFPTWHHFGVQTCVLRGSMRQA